MTYDEAYARNLAETVCGHNDPAAPKYTRRDCSWCGGTGRSQVWIGWTRIDDDPCARCAGQGHILVEAGCYD